MAVPNTPILDDFNRSDQSPVAGIWTGPLFTSEAQLRVVSQELTIISGGEGNSYINTQYGPNIEAYFTLTSDLAAGARILVYFRATTGTDITGYRIDIRNIAGDNIINVDRLNGASALTQLGGAAIDPEPNTFTDGDKFLVQMIGDTINVYYDDGGDGSWELLGSRTDSTYTGAGYIGVAIVGSVTIDDFGGGELEEAVYINNTFTQLAAGSVNGSRSFNTPSGAASGDRLIAAIKLNKVGGGSVPSVSNLPDGWSELANLWQDDINHTYDSSLIVISGLHDGSSGSYSVTIANASGTSEGGNITCVAYRGSNVGVVETTTLSDTTSGLSHTGPSQTVEVGETCVAIVGGPANANTLTWTSPFAERTDNEYYGLVSIAEADGWGTSLDPDITLSTTGVYLLWALVRLGITGPTLDTALPDADITTTGWSTAPLFSKINDASDATVITATAS